MKYFKEGNFVYLIWIIFYTLLLWLFLGASATSFGLVVIAYISLTMIACTPLAEMIWRSFNGVRAVATQKEKDRLLPIFEEVYKVALENDKYLYKNIKLFIKDTMDINAFAFGKQTLTITKGSINLLNDEQLKGLMAHEFGHFSHYDTVVLLFSSTINLLMESFLRFVCWVTKPIGFLHNIIMGFRNSLVFIGDLILMSVSRENEYLADSFADECGYSENLINVLYQFYETSMEEPAKFMEQLRSTHPPLVTRIEWLEDTD